jgi:DNA-binding response OmpR family regulator
MRILLVEDDELLGSGVSEALERKRYPRWRAGCVHGLA